VNPPTVTHDTDTPTEKSKTAFENYFGTTAFAGVSVGLEEDVGLFGQPEIVNVIFGTAATYKDSEAPVSLSASFQITATFRVDSEAPAGSAVGLLVTVGEFHVQDALPTIFTIDGVEREYAGFPEQFAIETEVGAEHTFTISGSNQESDPLLRFFQARNRMEIVNSEPLPDLAADPLNSMTFTGDDVEYTYKVLSTPDGNGGLPNGAVPVAFYWATGPNPEDRIGGPAHMATLTGSDATVGSHTKLLSRTSLSTRPANATHLAMVLDPQNVVIERNSNNNFASMSVVHPRFLQQPGSGINANVPFTVSVEMVDYDGMVVADYSGSITVDLFNTSSAAILSGTQTVEVTNGVAVFNDLAVNLGGEGFILRADSPNGFARSAAFNVTGAVIMPTSQRPDGTFV
jgi:hypothetical protein